MCFIGIDIGTSSICGVLYDLEENRTETITLDNTSAIPSPHSWERIQDTSVIIRLVYDILDKFRSRYTDIQGISITGQMHGILYVDKNGNAISPLYTWQDNRGNQFYRDHKTYAVYLSEKTGYNVSTGYGLVTHYYNVINQLVPAQAEKICTIMDYVVMNLSGSTTPVTDYSNGASLGLFDVKALAFDLNAIARAGIDCSVLPELTAAVTRCGYYEGAIPVYSAIGDNQAAFLGSVKDIHKSIHITVGTSSQISVYSDKYICIPELDTRPFPGGGYILVGAALCGGQALALLKDFFEHTLRLFSCQLLTDDIYTIMTQIDNDDTQDIPIVETLFNGTRHAPGKKGKIDNISVTNFTPVNLIRGFINGISHELYSFYSKLPEGIINEKQFIVGSGNGVKKNPLLRNALSEEFNCRIELSPIQEEAAFGACINAMNGGGYE